MLITQTSRAIPLPRDLPAAAVGSKTEFNVDAAAKAATEVGMKASQEKRDLPAIVWYIPLQFVFTALGAVEHWLKLRKLCAKYWILVQPWRGLKQPELGLTKFFIFC